LPYHSARSERIIRVIKKTRYSVLPQRKWMIWQNVCITPFEKPVAAVTDLQATSQTIAAG
jgi:hypothetical protein